MSYTSCKDCQERYPGCHSKCKKYQEFRKARDAEIEENLKRKQIVDVLSSYNHKRRWR